MLGAIAAVVGVIIAAFTCFKERMGVIESATLIADPCGPKHGSSVDNTRVPEPIPGPGFQNRSRVMVSLPSVRLQRPRDPKSFKDQALWV